MTNMHVSFQAMYDQAQMFDQEKQAMNDTLARLQGKVGELTGGEFKTDQASDAFNQSYQEFTRGTNEAVNGLENMAAYLRTSADLLREAEERMAAAARGGR